MTKIYKTRWLYVIGIIVILLYSYKALASAWLPEPKKYKYTFSFSSINDKAKRNKQERADFYLKIQQKIASLDQVIKDLTKSSALYNKIYQDIQYLKKIAAELESYKDESTSTLSLEYGVNDSKSFGVNALYKNNEFYKVSTNTQSFDIFYKFKLFHSKSYIFTIQPKIIINKDSNSSQELFHEISFLVGLSKKKKSAKFFSESSFAIGLCGSKSCYDKQYYSFAVSEGVKLPLGLMLVNFTKYYIRQNYGTIYSNTIYEQLSIAKEINMGNMNKKNLTIQLGYFWDKSLKKVNYQISGTVFSVWLDI